MLLSGIAVFSLIFAAVLYVAVRPALWLAVLGFVLCFLLGLGIAFAVLLVQCNRVDMEKEQEEDSPFYRSLMHLYIEALVTLVGVRIHAEGLEKVPQDGRFLLVCNHLHMADPGIVLHCFKKSQLAFIAKQESRDMFIVGPIMHSILCQFIDRDNDRSALKTILKCIQILKEDKASVCVFPEGYTSRDGKLHHFRSGVFKIAQKANVPIVVCTIQNTQSIFRNMKKLKKTHVPLRLVEVIPPEEIKSLSTVELSERIYECMIADLGEDFRV